METICKTPAEASKRIRTELKAAFPGIKFSVRTHTYSMGDSINISWTNGPTDKAVCAIVKKYEYGRFDGMTDSSSTEETLVSMPNGEVANLGGAKHVFTRREVSEVIILDAERAVCGLNGVEHNGPETPVMGNSGQLYWSARQIALRVLRAADLSKGYKGLRIVDQTEARIGFEDRIDVIPEGEVAEVVVQVLAPVESITIKTTVTRPEADEIAPAVICAFCLQPTEAPVQVEGVCNFYDYCPPCAARRAALKAPKPSEEAKARGLVCHAAADIIHQIGAPILTMRAEARRAAVYHRAYIRYPSLDRAAILTAVLGLLMSDLMKDGTLPMYASDDWDGGQSAYAGGLEDAIAADPDEP